MIKARIAASDAAQLDAAAVAVRGVLDRGSVSRTYPNRRGGRRPRVHRRRRGAAPAGQVGPGGSPLARAEDAKRRRDLAGEVDALLAVSGASGAQRCACAGVGPKSARLAGRRSVRLVRNARPTASTWAATSLRSRSSRLSR